MKKVFITLTVVAFSASLALAQAPATTVAKPAIDAVKAAPAKAKEAAKTAVDAAKAAPAKAKEAVAPAVYVDTQFIHKDNVNLYYPNEI